MKKALLLFMIVGLCLGPAAVQASLDPVWAAWLPALGFGSLGVVLTEGIRS